MRGPWRRRPCASSRAAPCCESRRRCSPTDRSSRGGRRWEGQHAAVLTGPSSPLPRGGLVSASLPPFSLRWDGGPTRPPLHLWVPGLWTPTHGEGSRKGSLKGLSDLAQTQEGALKRDHLACTEEGRVSLRFWLSRYRAHVGMKCCWASAAQVRPSRSAAFIRRGRRRAGAAARAAGARGLGPSAGVPRGRRRALRL